jgi:hypothetical protein
VSAAFDRDELRSLFLFESLTDEQLDWLAARAERRTYDASVVVHREGDRSAELFVLLAGHVRISRLVNGDDVLIIESDRSSTPPWTAARCRTSTCTSDSTTTKAPGEGSGLGLAARWSRQGEASLSLPVSERKVNGVRPSCGVSVVWLAVHLRFT